MTLPIRLYEIACSDIVYIAMVEVTNIVFLRFFITTCTGILKKKRSVNISKTTSAQTSNQSPNINSLLNS